MSKDSLNTLDVGYVRGTLSAGFALRQRAKKVKAKKPEIAAELLAMADIIESLTPDDIPAELIDTRTTSKES